MEGDYGSSCAINDGDYPSTNRELIPAYRAMKMAARMSFCVYKEAILLL